jgi:hypothetical protein
MGGKHRITLKFMVGKHREILINGVQNTSCVTLINGGMVVLGEKLFVF